MTTKPDWFYTAINNQNIRFQDDAISFLEAIYDIYRLKEIAMEIANTGLVSVKDIQLAARVVKKDI